MKRSRGAILLLLYCLSHACYAQEQPAGDAGALSFPTRLFGRIQDKTASLDKQLTHQTEKYLQRMQRREQQLFKKLSRVDSNGAKALFAGSQEQYAAFSRRLATDTGGVSGFGGEYHAYTDSLQGILKFMGANPASAAPLRQLQTLQARLKDADQLKEYVRQRREQLSQYIQQHANLSHLLGKDYQGLNQEVYYYSQRVHQYKEALNDPDKLEKEALQVLGKLPAFQAFMKQHSQLAGLFNLPGNYSTAASLSGLQTRDQVSALIQQQVAAGGAGGQAALQANLQSAQSQMDNYKEKLNKLGGGSGDIEVPDFKPNNQKTKTFWQRLEYGTNFQTTRNNYAFPTVSDLGLSAGYKLNDKSVVGVGASYKLGWGNGIQDIAFSSRGMGLRSFFEIKVKGSFSATGGLEYNYTIPFSNVQQLYDLDNWSKSGLIGISKTLSMNSRVFRKTKMQLLWDFLSYQQVPRTQAVLFRIGYNF